MISETTCRLAILTMVIEVRRWQSINVMRKWLVYYLVLDPDWMIALSVTADTWNSRVPTEWGHVFPLNNLPDKMENKILVSYPSPDNWAPPSNAHLTIAGSVATCSRPNIKRYRAMQNGRCDLRLRAKERQNR